MNSKLYRHVIDNSLFHVLALTLAILICYYGLWNSYFWGVDDFLWTGLMRHRATLSEAIQGLGNGVRFLNYAMVWTKTQLFDINSALYFWSSLLQHAIVTYIIYRLVEFWTQRRTTAFLAALLYTTKFSYYEVVSSVSASDYSVWAIFYLITLGLFSLYLDQRRLLFYFGSVGAYTILAFAHDFTLSMPLVLLAYHLTLGLRSQSSWSLLKWSELKVHFPYWVLWAAHVSIQFYYVFSGTSEAIYSEEGYGPGLHMIRNLFYLVSLLMPNVYLAPIRNFLTSHLGSDLVQIIGYFSIGLAVAAHTLAILCFWRGTALIRFALALIYLPFLQYTLWHGNFANASRYLYLPSIGFSILLAILLIKLHDTLRSKEGLGYHLIMPGLTALVVLVNLVMVQVWVRQQVENGKFRRPFVTQLASNFQNVEPNARIYIEVPQEKFVDLEASCDLVIRQPVQCEAFVAGERSLDEISANSNGQVIYWLQATNKGFSQLYPALTTNQ